MRTGSRPTPPGTEPVDPAGAGPGNPVPHLLSPGAASGAGTHPTDLVLAFAQAIARPGGKALLIDEHNKAVRWVSLEAAAENGMAFAVDVANDIVAIDADHPGREPDVIHLAELVERDGCSPVLVNSGRPGHLHLFARVGDPKPRDRYKRRARALRLDVRQTIRPPLAPHRLGLPVSLRSPADPAAALAALAPHHRAARPLAPKWMDLLRTGNHAEYGYPSRSHAIQAFTWPPSTRAGPRTTSSPRSWTRRVGWATRSATGATAAPTLRAAGSTLSGRPRAARSS